MIPDEILGKFGYMSKRISELTARVEQLEKTTKRSEGTKKDADGWVTNAPSTYTRVEYKCTKCRETFMLESDLDWHMQFHKEKGART